MYVQVDGAVLRPATGSPAMDVRVTVFGRVACARAGTLAWRQGLDLKVRLCSLCVFCVVLRPV